MGEIVLAAKITHVPSMFISEEEGPNQRLPATGHRRTAKPSETGFAQTGVDTVIIADTHWLVNAGYHINANTDCSGTYTSTEFPHFIRNLGLSLHRRCRNSARQLPRTATSLGTFTRCHTDVPSLGLQYGTLVPLKFMGIEDPIRIVSIAAWIYDAELEESRIMGAAVRKAVEASERKAAFLASGSLSHRIAPNRVVDDYLFRNSSPFNEKTDLMVLDLWKQGRIRRISRHAAAVRRRLQR